MTTIERVVAIIGIVTPIWGMVYYQGGQAEVQNQLVVTLDSLKTDMKEDNKILREEITGLRDDVAGAQRGEASLLARVEDLEREIWHLRSKK